jgi:cytochrome c nitrite reductase small subunit
MRLAPAIAASAFGLLVGLGLSTFDYAEGLSYMSEDPRACVNCHIMVPQYDAWQKSSHHTVATCVDCHLPDSFPAKYVAKARNGWFHSRGFTLQDFPEPILITPPNAAILQDNCVRCHDGLLHDATAAAGAPTCVHCHADVGHGETVGLGGPMRDYPTPEHE